MRSTLRAVSLVSVAVWLAVGVGGVAVAQDWPQWRGPGRDNKVTGFTAPAAWPKELTKKWQVKVGSGDSSPVLVGDKLYVFARQGDKAGQPSGHDPGGNDKPAARAYQQAMFQEQQPAIMFYTNDVKGNYERIKARGGEFTMPPTEVMAGSVIATVKDTCGNLIQVTQLAGSK